MLQDKHKSKFPEFELYTVEEEEGSGKKAAKLACGKVYHKFTDSHLFTLQVVMALFIEQGEMPMD